ncbi:stage VI sporulation protein D [Halobacillus litoralis]|uniref:stage VI sporulation protein D n=1 Tax=Halobacillus litoralis TaxID=45668 RepID=UPI001CD6B054|nr:stage VI sporulation protein D [Halobacillus litoralis]MCA0969914.1 stage VI sporulation protein D [Halobacillus litoralis]
MFSFYLDESVWFKEGQGVRELIGISLEPEIVIEERANEVCLKGTVKLDGEYFAQGKQGDDEALPFTARVVDYVEEGEAEDYRFSHAFPVEVTVPLNRVSSLDEVFVDIESFDYEIPATNQLRLHAQLNINGIDPQPEQTASNDKGFDQQATIGPVNYPEPKAEEPPLFPEREAPVFQVEQEEEKKEEESGRWQYKKSQSLSEFFGHEEEKEEIIEVSSSESVSMEESSSSHHEPSVSTESSSSETSEQEAPSGMDGIKQIFKHLFPNREESYTQMKMYIAQDQETFQSIAEKYDVSVKQLERVNGNEEDVSPGQIVYIPN